MPHETLDLRQMRRVSYHYRLPWHEVLLYRDSFAELERGMLPKKEGLMGGSLAQVVISKGVHDLMPLGEQAPARLGRRVGRALLGELVEAQVVCEGLALHLRVALLHGLDQLVDFHAQQRDLVLGPHLRLMVFELFFKADQRNGRNFRVDFVPYSAGGPQDVLLHAILDLAGHIAVVRPLSQRSGLAMVAAWGY